MSTALRKYEFAHIKEFTVAAGQSATAGRAVLLSGADTTIGTAGADSDLAIGFALETAAAGARCQVALLGPVVPVVVGTGACTRGKKAILVADGVTDAPAHDSSGGTDDQIYGIFMQTGVKGDTVGMILAPSNRGSA